MFIKLIILTTLTFLSLSRPDYQERNVYYNECDNACFNSRDIIRLNFNLDDRDKPTYEFDMLTTCTHTHGPRYASSISAARIVSWADYKKDEKVTDVWLLQESTKKYALGFLTDLIVNTTVIVPIMINKVNYVCVIIGDGMVQNFGISFNTPAEMYKRCSSIKKETDKLGSEEKMEEFEIQAYQFIVYLEHCSLQIKGNEIKIYYFYINTAQKFKTLFKLGHLIELRSKSLSFTSFLQKFSKNQYILQVSPEIFKLQAQ